MRRIVLDIDGALPGQPALQAALAAGEARLVPARDLDAKLRILGGRRALAELAARLPSLRGDRDGAPLIFCGSGDFHHLSALFLSRLDRAVTVLHFDNHPDWTGFPATINCGAWVCRALELPSVERVVTIGPASDDFVRPELQWAKLDAIRQGRLEVHPYKVAPSRIYGRPVEGPGCHTEGGHIVWHNLADRDWQAFCEALDQRLPDRPIWVTLDKDVLVADEAITNWDQGGMRLDPILGLVARLARTRRIVGMDVCGDYSPPVFPDLFRAFLSATDRPRLPVPDPKRARAVNDRTNARILAAAQGFLA